MAKKIALLLSLVMMFSISCVFATEADDTAATDTVVSGEVLEETTEVSGDEVVDADVVEGEVSGETEEPTTTPVEDEDVSSEVAGNETGSVETENGNGTILAAVIAIVIVVAIVAIVSVLKKK